MMYSRSSAANPARTGDRTQRNTNAKKVLDKKNGISDVFSVVKCKTKQNLRLDSFQAFAWKILAYLQHFFQKAVKRKRPP